MPEEIRGYHAHVYFDAETIGTAQQICVAVRDQFGAKMGRVHEKPVGPHPEWSCQLAFAPADFPRIVPWLALNRQGLTVFLHPDTGNDLEDHRDHAIWMGAMPTLRLEVFG